MSNTTTTKSPRHLRATRWRNDRGRTGAMRNLSPLISHCNCRRSKSATRRSTTPNGLASGSASVAGVKRAIADGIIKEDESVCAVITGNDLKDIKAAIETAGAPIHISPDLLVLDDELKKRRAL